MRYAHIGDIFEQYASVDPFIQLTAAIALLVTALLGIVGYMYVIQNKASIAANATPHELIQEAAERQRAKDKAGKQLEQVQLQQQDFLNPFAFATVTPY